VCAAHLLRGRHAPSNASRGCTLVKAKVKGTVSKPKPAAAAAYTGLSPSRTASVGGTIVTNCQVRELRDLVTRQLTSYTHSSAGTASRTAATSTTEALTAGPGAMTSVWLMHGAWNQRLRGNRPLSTLHGLEVHGLEEASYPS